MNLLGPHKYYDVWIGGNIALNTLETCAKWGIYLDETLNLEKDNSSRSVKLKANLYYNLAWAMRKLKEFEAYDNLEIAQEFTDKIRCEDESSHWCLNDFSDIESRRISLMIPRGLLDFWMLVWLHTDEIKFHFEA